MKTKTKRRRWHADPSALFRTMSKVQPFTQQEVTTLILPAVSAWDELKNGRGQETHYHTLAAVANVCLLRAEDVEGDIDELCLDMVKRAQEALLTIKERNDRSGRWGVCYISLERVPPMLDFYQQLVELSTPLQMQQAMKAVIARVNAGEVLELEIA